jgi:putative Holliday junction resolvase
MARVLGIDPGGKRVGIAVSDPTGTVAQPLSWIAAEPAATLVERLTRLAREQEAQELVVGLPWRMDGSQGPEARAARQLASQLRKTSGLPVTLVDERLTSVAAERALISTGERRERRRQLSDQVAAALLLQGHLDSRGRRGRV